MILEIESLEEKPLFCFEFKKKHKEGEFEVETCCQSLRNEISD